MDALSEAEIQALIALIELEDPKETPNNNFYPFYPANLDQASKYFRNYREDWDEAFRVLTSMELVCTDSVSHRLTPAGRVVASRWRELALECLLLGNRFRHVGGDDGGHDAALGGSHDPPLC